MSTTGKYPFVVVANRLPIDEVTDETGTVRWQRSPGGLVSALHPIMQRRDGAWVGWHGQPGAAPEPFDHDGIHLHPVPLSEQDVDFYYEGQSNSTIWPLYHDAVEQPVYHRTWRQAYRVVNQRFAEAAADVVAEGGVVWVHDYQLQLVPGMLRELRPDLRIGFFLHIPFPPTELFTQLPLRAEVIQGLLGADLVGFQHPSGASNFRRLAKHLLGLDHKADRVFVPGREVRAAAFPISIDVGEIERLAADPLVKERAAIIRAELGNPETIFLAVDRLDYTKGIEHRLRAFHELLHDARLDPVRTVLVQVAVPSRQRVVQYQELRERVEQTVGRINGTHAEVGRSVVHYLHRGFPRDELVALYLAADVMTVTPLRDGMNLVAKEYVAARIKNDGTLVLSEFAGAAAQLKYAYNVNPHDIDEMKNRFVEAAQAPLAEQKQRMRRMRDHLRHHDVNRWAASFLHALEETRDEKPRESIADDKEDAGHYHVAG